MLGLILLGLLCACGEPVELKLEEPLAPPTSGCGDAGDAVASLYGSIETHIAWSADDMACDSMQRPNGRGVRLQFVGDASGERLAIIIALPELNREDIAVEVPSNVTVTVEGSGRFFSTSNLDACWTEVISQTKLVDDGDAYALEAILFCISPLGEINGDAAVSIPEFSFSTIVNWNGK